MPIVKQKHANERFDSLLRRFKNLVDEENTLKTFLKKRFHEKKSTKKARAHAAAIKRFKKQADVKIVKLF